MNKALNIFHCKLVFLSLLLSACSIIPYPEPANKNLDHKPYFDNFDNVHVNNVDKASEKKPIDDLKDDGDEFLAVAISGGGSRAAVFSAQVLFDLEELGIANRIDTISSVSGGSLTAALYTLSCQDKHDFECTDTYFECTDTYNGTKRPQWSEEVIFNRLDTQLMDSYLRNAYLNPLNWPGLWFGQLDRTDVLTEVFEDNLFDPSFVGGEGFLFGDLNEYRPGLIINATKNSNNPLYRRCIIEDGAYFFDDNSSKERKKTREISFTFTTEVFECLNSHLRYFGIANAVAASAAFPGVFNYVTLEDHEDHEDHESQKGHEYHDEETVYDTRYIHLFDGGASDNLGLTAIRHMLGYAKKIKKHPRPAVILIDAHVADVRANSEEADPRSTMDHIFDDNSVHAIDKLMSEIRSAEIKRLKDELCEESGPDEKAEPDDKAESCRKDKQGEYDPKSFIHLTFDSLNEVPPPFTDSHLKEWVNNKLKQEKFGRPFQIKEDVDSPLVDSSLKDLSSLDYGYLGPLSLDQITASLDSISTTFNITKENVYILRLAARILVCIEFLANDGILGVSRGDKPDFSCPSKSITGVFMDPNAPATTS
jgi:hypothetical protein